MKTFPAFFPLKGARVVIAGEGDPAEARARLFEGSPARVIRLTGDAALKPGAYQGANLIFIASRDEDFARAAATAARAAGAPVNVVDRPALCDFHTPAIVDRGDVVAAIGTAGSAPMLASLLRAQIETHVSAAAGRIAALLGQRREALRVAFPDLVQRRAFLRAMLASPPTAEGLDAAIAAGWSAVGRVSLIVAPASDDLVSVRALRTLNIADIIVADEVCATLIAAHARRDAEHLKDADATALAGLARDGRIVAVISRAADPRLADDLAGLGVACETLHPAPAL